MTSFARSLVVSSSPSTRSSKLIVAPSLLEAKEGLPEGPVSSRAASLGLLIVTTKSIAQQLARSQTSLTDFEARLATVHTLPVTELIRVAEINSTEKIPTVIARKMANDKISSTICSKSREVTLCAGALEGLMFLVWRHLEHFLLYSNAANTLGPSTPFQQAFNRHNTSILEIGGSTASHRTAFSQVDLEKLKKDIAVVLSETYFDKLTDVVNIVEDTVKSKASSAGFLQSILRRSKRLAVLHTQ